MTAGELEARISHLEAELAREREEKAHLLRLLELTLTKAPPFSPKPSQPPPNPSQPLSNPSRVSQDPTDQDQKDQDLKDLQKKANRRARNARYRARKRLAETAPDPRQLDLVDSGSFKAPPKTKSKSVSLDAETDSAPASDEALEGIRKLWNTLRAPELPEWTVTSMKTRRQVAARLAERPLTGSPDSWEAVFRRVARCPYLRGLVPDKHGRLHIAKPTWLMSSPDWAERVLEGTYDPADWREPVEPPRVAPSGPVVVEAAACAVFGRLGKRCGAPATGVFLGMPMCDECQHWSLEGPASSYAEAR